MPLKAVPVCGTCVSGAGRPLRFPDSAEAIEHLQVNPDHYIIGRAIVWEDEE